MKIHDLSKAHNIKAIVLTLADGTTKRFSPYPPTPEDALEIVRALAEDKIHSLIIKKDRLQ